MMIIKLSRSPRVSSIGPDFVVNTPSDTVDVIDATSLAIITPVNVGIDPVGIAERSEYRDYHRNEFHIDKTSEEPYAAHRVRGEGGETLRGSRYGRDLRTATSTDFIHWSEPEYVDYTQVRHRDRWSSIRLGHALAWLQSISTHQSGRMSPPFLNTRTLRRYGCLRAPRHRRL